MSVLKDSDSAIAHWRLWCFINRAAQRNGCTSTLLGHVGWARQLTAQQRVWSPDIDLFGLCSLLYRTVSAQSFCLRSKTSTNQWEKMQIHVKSMFFFYTFYAFNYYIFNIKFWNSIKYIFFRYNLSSEGKYKWLILLLY